MTRATRSRRLRLAVANERASGPPPQNETRGLEIRSVQAWRLREPSSRRTWCLLRLETRSGLAGCGECPELAGSDVAAARQALGGKVVPFERALSEFAAIPALRASVNAALLDILARTANAPLYQFLGGPTRFRVRAMATLEGATEASLIESARLAQSRGYRAFAVPVPPPLARNQGQAYVAAVRRRMDALRAALGDAADFVLDGRGLLSPGDAASVAAAMERFHLYWFDEPCSSSGLTAARKLASETVTPLGFGRDISDAARFQALLAADAIDVLRPSIALNGITTIRKMAAIAETYYVAVAPFHNGGPIATAAALHLAASLPNFFVQQIPFPSAEEDRRMRAALVREPVEQVREGFASLPRGPGLGVTVDMEALRKHGEEL